MFEKIKLDYTSLEPYIDNRTLDIHYNKHYQKYLDNLNILLNKGNYKFSSIYDLIQNIDKINLNDRGEILFNLGGVLNHSLYFYDMSDKKNNKPIGKIKDDIEIYFNTYDNFKKKFKESAMSLQGSGYTFLVLDDKNNLKIINTSNQDTPYYYGFIPIIALDLWEHSYYLKYQNKKDEYINAWFNLIDYIKINKLYEDSLNKKNTSNLT